MRTCRRTLRAPSRPATVDAGRHLRYDERAAHAKGAPGLDHKILRVRGWVHVASESHARTQQHGAAKAVSMLTPTAGCAEEVRQSQG